ncbi:glutathione S-transferase family protein [Allorhizobium borbori]|uniref:Glutathione S-transferase n=1 Tax=Allorhizobium borbori TaxID=485907 RepID=A0A7W6K3G4_9HYPH|nr:glutathione S-transferase family protein [Allorhizobium borbori]MBB4104427.1 glutathione S-transferase [Allorhizobium borbori]
MLKIYGRPDSSNSAKVFWLLDEIGADFEHILCGGRHGGNDRPEYLAINPHGKVPTIDDDGTIVWESNAILRYLAERYGATALWPQAAGERAHIDQWMDWSATALVPALGRVRKSLKDNRSAAEALMPAAIAAFTAFDAQLSTSQFMAGDNFTLADIASGPAVARWFLIPFPKPELRNLGDYLGRLAERPSFKRTIAPHIS